MACEALSESKELAEERMQPKICETAIESKNGCEIMCESNQ